MKQKDALKLPTPPTMPTLIGMALGLALFYRGGTLALALPGLLIFGALTLLRPDLGLLFVPLTAPLYLMPAAIEGLRAGAFLVPLHEAALLAVAGAAGARWLWGLITDRQPPTTEDRGLKIEDSSLDASERRSAILHPPSSILSFRALARDYAPHLLFLAAGAIGVLLAVPEGRGAALREFRWLIIEPLIFYALLAIYDVRFTIYDLGATTPVQGDRKGSPLQFSASRFTSSGSWFLVGYPLGGSRLVVVFILGGALVALVGVLQFVGPDPAPLLGVKQCFTPSGAVCDNVIVAGGARRVTSVYGHPNNLGLYLGRIWPLAAALALAPLLARTRQGANPRFSILGSWFFGLCALLCLAGIVVSFSRGAWLGAVAAGAVLALGLTTVPRDKVTRRQGDKVTESEESITGSPLHRVAGPRDKVTRPQGDKVTESEESITGSPLHRVTVSESSVVSHRSSVAWLIGLGAVLVILGGLVVTLRGGLGGGSDSARVLIWREALAYLRLHPLGIGLDQFLYYHNPAYGRSLIDPTLLGSSEVYAAHPHNLLLDTWLRLGPLGLIAFVWLLARFFRTARALAFRGADPLCLGALAALAAALVHGLVDNFYFIPDLAFAFWLLLALVESAGRIHAEATEGAQATEGLPFVLTERGL